MSPKCLFMGLLSLSPLLSSFLLCLLGNFLRNAKHCGKSPYDTLGKENVREETERACEERGSETGKKFELETDLEACG